MEVFHVRKPLTAVATPGELNGCAETAEAMRRSCGNHGVMILPDTITDNTGPTYSHTTVRVDTVDVAVSS